MNNQTDRFSGRAFQIRPQLSQHFIQFSHCIKNPREWVFIIHVIRIYNWHLPKHCLYIKITTSVQGVQAPICGSSCRDWLATFPVKLKLLHIETKLRSVYRLLSKSFVQNRPPAHSTIPSFCWTSSGVVSPSGRGSFWRLPALARRTLHMLAVCLFLLVCLMDTRTTTAASALAIYIISGGGNECVSVVEWVGVLAAASQPDWPTTHWQDDPGSIPWRDLRSVAVCCWLDLRRYQCSFQ